ncbi:MAG: hypothetical protein KAI24_03170 [Planctomycetes bacterium]|nr:hypothetical protein [Planctomycetota bacterium]
MPTRFANPWFPAALLLAAAAGAQIPTPEPAQVDPKRGAPQQREGRYHGSYSESVSRELFRACDGNSDDRLDVFETVDAFDLLPSARDHRSYARFDTDRDGFVTWPEFDQRFRKSLEAGGTFRVRTARSFTMPEPPPQKETPLRQFLRTFDADGDGALSPTEIEQLLKATGLPTTLAVPLMASDLDGSGSIDEAELAPWFESLPIAQLTASAGASPLPQPWFDGDRDGDGAIDLEELRAVLRGLDPGLLRWAADLLQKLDADKDGKLRGPELQRPEAPAAAKPAGAKPTPAKKSPPAPQR